MYLVGIPSQDFHAADRPRFRHLVSLPQTTTFSFSSVSSILLLKNNLVLSLYWVQEGSLKNGYTIGKDAKQRASASIEYITRDENEKSIADLKDKNGNTISKLEAKQKLKYHGKLERRLVLSPNPRLNISEEQLDKLLEKL